MSPQQDAGMTFGVGCKTEGIVCWQVGQVSLAENNPMCCRVQRISRTERQHKPWRWRQKNLPLWELMIFCS